ncbi:MAG: IclR family transcriptional regulator [Rhodobacteraceae bacterium]|nr:IclR family transcriptional regulator [Paracoccaceae bacterium]MBT25979.1 IclR family transcriptional regulator [Paracoccaceae bacterium]
MGTITKALELMNFFSRHKPEIGLTDFVRLAGRDKATVHRHLTELLENGYLEQHPQTRAYRLGPAILRLSGVREATHPVRSVLRPIVTQIAQSVGELTHVSLLQGQTLSPVYHADPQVHATQVAFDEAETLPLHATASGIATLAYSDASFVSEILSQDLRDITGQTITDPQAIRDLLHQTRQNGFSALGKAFDLEVTSVAAPLFGPEGNVIGAVSIAIPNLRESPEKQTEICQHLAHAQAWITGSLGGVSPPMYRNIRSDHDPAPKRPT